MIRATQHYPGTVIHSLTPNLRFPQLMVGCQGLWNVAYAFERGTRVKDWSQAQNHLTLTNMDPATDWVEAVDKKAIDLDGSNDVLTSINNVYGLRTVSVWCRVTALTGFRRIVNCNGNQFSMFLSSGTMDIRHVYAGTTSAGFPAARYPVINTWFHVGLTFAGGNSITYLNGIPVDTTANTLATTDGFKINFGQLSAGSQQFIGQMAEMMIHNRPLSADEWKLLASRPGIALETVRDGRGRRSAAAAFKRRTQASQMIGGGIR